MPKQQENENNQFGQQHCLAAYMMSDRLLYNSRFNTRTRWSVKLLA